VLHTYALLNLFTGIKSEKGRWEVTLYGKNVFNTFRVTDRSGVAASAPTNLGTILSNYRTISTTSPREFGVTARVGFGTR
jgi:iron complex outermembrane recepter protein